MKEQPKHFAAEMSFSAGRGQIYPRHTPRGLLDVSLAGGRRSIGQDCRSRLAVGRPVQPMDLVQIQKHRNKRCCIEHPRHLYALQSSDAGLPRGHRYGSLLVALDGGGSIYRVHCLGEGDLSV